MSSERLATTQAMTLHSGDCPQNDRYSKDSAKNTQMGNNDADSLAAILAQLGFGTPQPDKAAARGPLPGDAMDRLKQGTYLHPLAGDQVYKIITDAYRLRLEDFYSHRGDAITTITTRTSLSRLSATLLVQAGQQTKSVACMVQQKDAVRIDCVG